MTSDTLINIRWTNEPKMNWIIEDKEMKIFTGEVTDKHMNINWRDYYIKTQIDSTLAWPHSFPATKFFFVFEDFQSYFNGNFCSPLDILSCQNPNPTTTQPNIT